MRALSLAVVALTACSSGEAAPRPAEAAGAAVVHPTHGDALAQASAELAAYETRRRAAIDWARPTPAGWFGADPWRLVALPGGGWAGLERGHDDVVALDAGGAVVARKDGPRDPTALAIDRDGTILVGGAVDRLVSYRIAGAVIRAETSEMAPRGLIRIRDLAIGADGTRYAVDDESGAVVAWRRDREAHAWRARCAGPVAVRVLGRHLAVACVLDHTVVVWRLDRSGRPTAEPPRTIRHDGPIWAIDGLALADRLWLALGGVEDHPLDRSDGTFGNVDSFAFLYRMDGDAAPVRRAAINLGEHGVITPKWIELGRGASGGLALTATGYGGDQIYELELPASGDGPPIAERTRAVPPGLVALARSRDGHTMLAADPLFDAWVRIDDDGARLARTAATATEASRSLDSRIGELLVFTRLIAPWAPTAGKASRFTCETCHFEGGVDGRTHFTGRGAVHATTKPLFGLFANRPHFTRALDHTTAQMVGNEFRVATKSSGRDPWWSIGTADLPWLADVLGGPGTIDPLRLRRSLMAFLIDLDHAPNPVAARRTRFTGGEATGAALFRDRCASCHPARLATDRPDTEVPFAAWPGQIFGAGRIVWARDGYEQTGIEPYVHERGARPPSLRRLARKRPYFTNGAAATLDDVLARAGWVDGRFFHDRAPTGATRLDSSERRALRSFLDLL